VDAREIKLQEIAPHVFTIDLQSLNTRVTVAEFADYVAVIEGAYSSRVGDLLVRTIRQQLGKPIRYFAFSHIHGQYVGSTRSFIAAGTTIIVPPSTAPMIEDIARAPHTLQPDALEVSPLVPKIERVTKSFSLADETNALTIFNVPSEHTDEYFIFWFPRPKILLTGDLLFYRPGKPVTGRSKRVCRTVAELGLKPERYVATWPLDGYDTKNVVSGEEMRAACEPAP
jgi:glyoxylase-like metal-dependent hydrolase (beta-lactamase superfamily II)